MLCKLQYLPQLLIYLLYICLSAISHVLPYICLIVASCNDFPYLSCTSGTFSRCFSFFMKYLLYFCLVLASCNTSHSFSCTLGTFSPSSTCTCDTSVSFLHQLFILPIYFCHIQLSSLLICICLLHPCRYLLTSTSASSFFPFICHLFKFTTIIPFVRFMQVLPMPLDHCTSVPPLSFSLIYASAS